MNGLIYERFGMYNDYDGFCERSAKGLEQNKTARASLEGRI